jgi:hypothetical protein
MIRRCVLKLLLVLLVMIEKRSQKNYRCGDNDAEIRMPRAEGRRNVKCPKFRVGRATPVRAIVSAGRGLPALPAPRARRGVVEAVVPTAFSRTNFLCRLCQTPGRFRTEPRGRSDLDGQAEGRASGERTSQTPYNLFQPYGAMRSVSVSV